MAVGGGSVSVVTGRAPVDVQAVTNTSVETASTVRTGTQSGRSVLNRLTTAVESWLR